mmetsp:Transcript_20671/g.46883  ORF Transcript_20671/g.46883 Transcript_20671/m.46883 type:complete len:208 (+) Transcript_20671:2323-2946(+)
MVIAAKPSPTERVGTVILGRAVVPTECLTVDGTVDRRFSICTKTYSCSSNCARLDSAGEGVQEGGEVGQMVAETLPFSDQLGDCVPVVIIVVVVTAVAKAGEAIRQEVHSSDSSISVRDFGVCRMRLKHEVNRGTQPGIVVRTREGAGTDGSQTRRMFEFMQNQTFSDGSVPSLNRNEDADVLCRQPCCCIVLSIPYCSAWIQGNML